MTDRDAAKSPAADSAAALAERADVDRGFVDELVKAGALTPDPDGAFSVGDLRRVYLIRDLDRGGIPSGLVAEALRTGTLNIDFIEQPSYDRFSAYETETFDELAHSR
jgi:hypothetical protein